MRELFTAMLGALALLGAEGATAQQAQSQPRSGEPVYTGLVTTRWGRAVTPENAWRSYPRPQMRRSAWANLNGHWDYAITKAGAARPERMDGRILVPFPVESRL